MASLFKEYITAMEDVYREIMYSLSRQGFNKASPANTQNTENSFRGAETDITQTWEKERGDKGNFPPYLPILCANVPKMLVPIRQEMDAGKKATPVPETDTHRDMRG